MTEDEIRDAAYTAWRNREIDETDTLPDGYAAFNAGWAAGRLPQHDHIDDGNVYLDCVACAPFGVDDPAYRKYWRDHQPTEPDGSQ